jgi:hypothetical protein
VDPVAGLAVVVSVPAAGTVVPVDGVAELSVVVAPVAGYVPTVVSVYDESVVPVDGLVVPDVELLSYWTVESS